VVGFARGPPADPSTRRTGTGRPTYPVGSPRVKWTDRGTRSCRINPIRDCLRSSAVRAARRLVAFRDVLITTMNDLPGWEIEEVLGEVFGLTVRSRNLGSQIGASLKSLVGGELKGMTKMLAAGRQHATDRLVEEAQDKGADAVIAFRFDTSELGSTWTEICAYGTAVRARKT
jgi:uncharacterized protein YbjQ (UPF0145 family)